MNYLRIAGSAGSSAARCSSHARESRSTARTSGRCSSKRGKGTGKEGLSPQPAAPLRPDALREIQGHRAPPGHPRPQQHGHHPDLYGLKRKRREAAARAATLCSTAASYTLRSRRTFCLTACASGGCKAWIST